MDITFVSFPYRNFASSIGRKTTKHKDYDKKFR